MQLNFNQYSGECIHTWCNYYYYTLWENKIYTLEEIKCKIAHNISSMYDIKLIKERNRVT